MISKKNIKPLALYFPQFHEFEENNRFWGKGFTEWNNLNTWKSEIFQAFGIKETDVDEIAIVVDAWKYNDSGYKGVFPAEKWNYLGTSVPTFRLNHHYAHALSDYDTHLPDVSIVIDGYGDYGIGHTVFKNEKIIDIGNIHEHGSLGIEMCMLAESLDIKAEHFVDLSGKLMGLQSYGNVDELFYRDTIENYNMYNLRHLFNFERWINYKGHFVLAQHSKLDWIRTIHEAMGEILLSFFKKFANKNDTISYSGGVAQNVIWNSKLKEYFPNLHIIPHCADDGLSLGAVEYLRRKNNLPKFTIKNFPFCQIDQTGDFADYATLKKVAELLSKNKIVAVYQGNGEIGPRALGHRSILINPMQKDAKDKINKIKNRESYRPFGASVLKDYKDEIFEGLPENPYMLYVGKTKDVKNYKSITHVDGTCRAQTVDKNNKVLHTILEEFNNLTSCPVLLNTSLNLAGKPIAGIKDDAFALLENTNIDYLLLDNKVYGKE